MWKFAVEYFTTQTDIADFSIPLWDQNFSLLTFFLSYESDRKLFAIVFFLRAHKPLVFSGTKLRQSFL